MDTRQRVVKKTFTRKQLEGMTVAELVALVGEAGPNARFEGTAVVRKADGSIRYDKESVPGTYGETPEELTRVANESAE